MKPIKPKPLPKRLAWMLDDIANTQGAEPMRITSRQARAILAALEYAKQRERSLLIAGAPLANCAFNLKQRTHLDVSERQSLEVAQREWDSVAGRKP